MTPSQPFSTDLSYRFIMSIRSGSPQDILLLNDLVRKYAKLGQGVVIGGRNRRPLLTCYLSGENLPFVIPVPEDLLNLHRRIGTVTKLTAFVVFRGRGSLMGRGCPARLIILTLTS